MLLALNAIRPDKNNSPPNAATKQSATKITSMMFDPSVVRYWSGEISGVAGTKPPATSSDIRPQNIKQRPLIVLLYLPHLMSARHPTRG